jgi:hypothetical protein
MSNVADAMEICNNNSYAATMAAARPPPIDTATPAAQKAIDAMTTEALRHPPIDTATPAAQKAIDAMVEDDKVALHYDQEAALQTVHNEYIEFAASDERVRKLEKFWNGGWVTVRNNVYQIEFAASDERVRKLEKFWNGGWVTVRNNVYQIYRYQLYQYDKKAHCVTHYGHYNPYTLEIWPDYLVPDFTKAPKGYSVRSALYA